MRGEINSVIAKIFTIQMKGKNVSRVLSIAAKNGLLRWQLAATHEPAHDKNPLKHFSSF